MKAHETSWVLGLELAKFHIHYILLVKISQKASPATKGRELQSHIWRGMDAERKKSASFLQTIYQIRFSLPCLSCCVLAAKGSQMHPHSGELSSAKEGCLVLRTMPSSLMWGEGDAVYSKWLIDMAFWPALLSQGVKLQSLPVDQGKSRLNLRPYLCSAFTLPPSPLSFLAPSHVFPEGHSQ